jgi:superfamily II DNA or RNA helicase
MKMFLDTSDVNDYRKFLRIKSLPSYRFCGDTAIIPDEYAEEVGGRESQAASCDYNPSSFLFDYQRDISRIAIAKRKYCLFADCGLGKTLIYMEYINHVRRMLPKDRAILIISPMMVVQQTLEEVERWYGSTLSIRQIHANELAEWLVNGAEQIGITNYDALTDGLGLGPGRLGCLVLDESSMLKSHYGKWGATCLRLGRGLEWKMAGTGTPAPNDRIEYANHAVFMDAFPTVNSFLSRFFVNKGQTQERWILRPHAVRPFYHALSHWCIFLTNPATYGWKDNTTNLPPINVHIHDVDLTDEQQDIAYESTGRLFADSLGGITTRSAMGQLSKGSFRGRDVETQKPAFIRRLVDSWAGESTIIWCLYNREQDILERAFPEAHSLRGDTPYEVRQAAINNFKAGITKTIISKPKVMGFGLNLHIATRQVFSGLQDSYEQYYQAVKRSNRYGATKPLNVHIPVTDLERPMIQTVLEKAARVQADTEEQERIFRDASAKRI